MTMPSTPFNVPRGSFETPVAPIGVSPLSGPLVQVEFNYKWCSVIVGSLSQLLLNTTWDVSTQAELTAIQEDVFDLMSAFCFSPLPANFQPASGAGGDDDFMLRQNPDNPCELQTSVDGITWCTWADLSKCIPQVTQPGAGTPQPSSGGGCQTYHAILPGSGEWLLPAPVNPGDVLTITNLKGASNDGTLSPWYCGDGNLFFAGLCLGSSTTQPGDPVPTSPHLSLIAKAGGLAFPILGGPISIGAVGAYQNLSIQVNDSILNDNSGSLEFDVEICNNQAGIWESVIDFRISPYTSFVTVVHGSWVASQGYESVPLGFPDTDDVQLSIAFSASDLTGGDLTYDSTANGSGGDNSVGFATPFGVNTGVLSGTHTVSAAASAPGTTTVVVYADSGASTATMHLQKLILRGTGTKPAVLP